MSRSGEAGNILGFTAVEIFLYFIPGSITVIAGHLLRLDRGLTITLPNLGEAVLIYLLIAVSFLVGHIMHYPAIVVGRVIDWLLGNPGGYVLHDYHPKNWLHRRFAKPFSDDYRRTLLRTLHEFWRIDIPPHALAKEYGALAEIFVEENCPSAWKIHERFYLASGFMRALILPTMLLALGIIQQSLVLGLFLAGGVGVFAYRYHAFNEVKVKQVFHGFYFGVVNRLTSVATVPESTDQRDRQTSVRIGVAVQQ